MSSFECTQRSLERMQFGMYLFDLAGLGVVHILRNQPRGGVAVHYIIIFLNLFYPLELYQFDNFNLNVTLILAAGPKTARYQAIFWYE